MKKLLLKEPTTLIGQVSQFLFIALLTVVGIVLLSLIVQGVPAMGRYLQNELGVIKTGYYFLSVAFVLAPATFIYILFIKK